MGAFFRYCLSCLWPAPAPPVPPPAGSLYGYAWVPGNGAPGTLDPAALAIIPPGTAGLFIGFREPSFDQLRWTGPIPPAVPPVFGYALSPYMPAAAAPAVTAMIAQLQANLPVGENWNVTAAEEIDLTGYFRYTAWCLNLLNQTFAGNAYLTALRTGGRCVVIQPFGQANNTVAVAGTARSAVAQALYMADGNMAGLNRAVITAAIDAQYAHLGIGLPRYNQFAADLNAMPLYSMFVDETQFNLTPTFLQTNCQYLGAPISGAVLMAWLTAPGTPAATAFEGWLVATGVLVVSQVIPRRFLFLAMTLQLAPNSAASAGADSVVGWNVLDENDNQQGNVDYRPPAIALGHELIHAYYNAAGTACGYDNNNFTTTGAELEVVGLTPFNVNAVSEDRVRAQWAAINNPVPDPTNTPPGPVGPLPRRTIYSAPPIGSTVAQTRQGGLYI